MIVIIIHYKTIRLDDTTNQNNKEHNEKWSYIPDHLYRILVIGDCGSGKTNALLNLINEHDDIDKIYLYAKDLGEPKYEFWFKKREDVGTTHLNDPNAFIESSNTINGVYENIDHYNPSRKKKVLCLMTWLQILWVTRNVKPLLDAEN